MNEQTEFIIEYLKRNGYTDVTDEKFHDEFHLKFGGKRKWHFFGASPVYKAQRLLTKMWKDGILDRGILSLSEHEQGFPNWVYGYSLKGDTYEQ